MNQSPRLQNINFGTISGRALVATFAILGGMLFLSLAGCNGKKEGQTVVTSDGVKTVSNKTGNAKIQEIDKAIEATRNNPQIPQNIKDSMIAAMEKNKAEVAK